MRKTVAALALSAATAGSLLLAGPAHAAAARTAHPAPAPDLPGYNCTFGLNLRIFPPVVVGEDCVAVNGAPQSGSGYGPITISFQQDGQLWICRAANADNYPNSVMGQDCSREGETPF